MSDICHCHASKLAETHKQNSQTTYIYTYTVHDSYVTEIPQQDLEQVTGNLHKK